MPTKNKFFFKHVFLIYVPLTAGTFTTVFKDNKSLFIKKSQNCGNQGFYKFFACWWKRFRSGSGRVIILRIRLRNAASKWWTQRYICTGGARFLGGLYLSPGVEPQQPLPPEGVRALPEELLQKGGRQQQRLPQHQRGEMPTTRHHSSAVSYRRLVCTLVGGGIKYGVWIPITGCWPPSPSWQVEIIWTSKLPLSCTLE